MINSLKLKSSVKGLQLADNKPSWLKFQRTQSRHYSTNDTKVGFIGLGEMGLRMAKNLLRKNIKVVGYDLREEPLVSLRNEFGSERFSSSNTPHGVIEKDVNVVVTMLPEAKHVFQVYLENGSNSLYEIANEGTLFIDSSTIGPYPARRLHEESKKKKHFFVDAPVSGGIRGAEEGTLTFMVGDKEDGSIARAIPYLQLMGKSIVDCKGPGNGQVAKIANNLVLGISMAAVSEGMNLGITLGMDPKILAHIFNTSTARCWSSDSYNPVPNILENIPSSRDYTGGFGVDLMAKDLRLAVDAGKEASVPLSFGTEALNLFTETSKHGLGKKDFSVVYQHLKSKNLK